MSISSSAPWLRAYGAIPEHIELPELTMYQLVAKTAAACPDLPAYEFFNRVTTYREFLLRIDRAAGAFYSIGIRKGDRVTLCLPNIPQALDCFYALNKLGAIPNMIHPLSAQKEILFYLEQSSSKAILTLDLLYDKVFSAAQEARCKPLVLLARIQDELSPLKKLGYRLVNRKTLPSKKSMQNGRLWSYVLRQSSQTPPMQDRSCNDCAVILYSGGTTGTTKGICLSDRNFNALALQTIAASGYPSIQGCSMLSVMPMFHGFGLGIGIHTALVGGAKCILVPKFSVSTYAKLLKTKKPNFIPGVPTLFEALLRTKKADKLNLSFLMGVFCGGDCLSTELKHRVDAYLHTHHAKVQIREGYGTTECVTASCLTPVDFAKDGSIGIPFPDTYYKIVAVGTEQEVDADTEGEICISGPTVMLGYLDNPEETAAVLRRHADDRLWLHTGDLGTMDNDGFVYFRQRIKRMIITSGFNVYPSQLENILDAHPKVQLSCVIGVQDAYRMQRVKAFVVLKPEFVPSDIIRRELLSYCGEHIAKYALPREIEFRNELPKTAVGKIAYRVLEQEEEANVQ